MRARPREWAEQEEKSGWEEAEAAAESKRLREGAEAEAKRTEWRSKVVEMGSWGWGGDRTKAWMVNTERIDRPLLVGVVYFYETPHVRNGNDFFPVQSILHLVYLCAFGVSYERPTERNGNSRVYSITLMPRPGPSSCSARQRTFLPSSKPSPADPSSPPPTRPWS